MISQIIGYIALWLITRSGGGMDVYYEQVVLLTGLTGILSMIPCLWFYSRDRIARKHGGLVLPQKPWKLDLPEIILLLGMGAAFSQYANMLVGMLQSVLNYQEYQETMDQMTAGKSMWFLLICMGVIAPLAEEIVFRWLIYLRLRDYMRIGFAMVISGMIFGIYHGNLVQAVYAGILGMVFADFLEISGCLWSSVLLHMGANLVACISGSCELDATKKSNVYSDHAVCIDTHFGLWVSLFPGKGERTDKKGFVNAYIKAEFCFEIKMNRNYTKEKLSG